MNWLRTRENAAFSKGLMMGKAAGVKEERKRIADVYEDKIILESDSLDKLIEIWAEDGATKERERIINDLKDQFAFIMECETKEGLQIEQNSIFWSERWQLTFNELIALIKGENK